MGNIKAEEAMRELTLMLLYLSRFAQERIFTRQPIFMRGKAMILIY